MSHPVYVAYIQSLRGLSSFSNLLATLNPQIHPLTRSVPSLRAREHRNLRLVPGEGRDQQREALAHGAPRSPTPIEGLG